MELSSFYGPTHLINMNGWAMTPWNTFPNIKSLVYAATQNLIPEEIADRAKNGDYDSSYFVIDNDTVITPLALFPDTNVFFIDYDRQAYNPVISGDKNSADDGQIINYLNELENFSDYIVPTDAKSGYPSWYKINYEIDKSFKVSQKIGEPVGQVYYKVINKEIYLSAPFERKISNFYNYETKNETNNSTVYKQGYDGIALQLYSYNGNPFFQIIGSLDEQWPQIVVDTYSPEWYEKNNEIFPKMDIDNSNPAEIRIKMAATPAFSQNVDLESTDQLSGAATLLPYNMDSDNHSKDPVSVTLDWDSITTGRKPYANTENVKDQKKFSINLAPINKIMGILYNVLYGTDGNPTQEGSQRNSKYMPGGANVADYQNSSNKNLRGILEQMYCLNGLLDAFSNDVDVWVDDDNLKNELSKFANETKAIIYPLYDYITTTETSEDTKVKIDNWITKLKSVVDQFYNTFGHSQIELEYLIVGLKKFYDFINEKYAKDQSIYFPDEARFPAYYKENYNVVHSINHMFTPFSFKYKPINGIVTTNSTYKDDLVNVDKDGYGDGKLNDQKIPVLEGNNMIGRTGYSFNKDGISPDRTIIRCKLNEDSEITDIVVRYGQIADGASFVLPTSVRVNYGTSEESIAFPFGEADIRTVEERDNAEINASRVSRFYVSSPIRANYIDIIFENDDKNGVKKGAYGLGIDEITINGKPAVPLETTQQIAIGEFFQFYKTIQPQIQKILEMSFDSDNTVLFSSEEIATSQWKYNSDAQCYLCDVTLISPDTWDNYGVLQPQRKFSIMEFAINDNTSEEIINEIIYNDIQISENTTDSLELTETGHYQIKTSFRSNARPQKSLKLSALITF